MEEGDVLDCFAVRPHFGVDLAAPAEDRYRLQIRLAVDPGRPQPAIRLEEAEADIRYGADPGFHELVVDSYRPSLLDDLIPATGRPPYREVRRQHEIEAHAGQFGDDATPRNPEAFEDPVLHVQLQRDLGLRPEAIDLANRPPVLPSDPPPGRAEDAAAVQRDPGQIHGIGVGLDQDRKVIRQVGKYRVAYLSRPVEIEAAEMLDDLASRIHHLLLLQAAGALTAKAEVGFLAAAGGGRTLIAVRTASNPCHHAAARRRRR